ncbi:MAG: hypothetical protein JWL69_3239 [Phycisphaerales bacterium]|jgi:hypothetical protein|nr:hypothetical protein [Phycisphaerales bacterium]MDB5357130.1 hypothetical protein [Phycisphaerales bacterium]
MRNSTYAKVFVVLIASAFTIPCFVGCGPTPPAGWRPQVSRDPEYSLGFHNSTQAPLLESEIEWMVDGRHFHDGGGLLYPGGRGKTSSFAPDPIPVSVHVTWKTSDGQTHEQNVEVASHVPDLPHFTGVIWFNFTDEGVQVVPRSKAEQLRLLSEGKPPVP